MTESSRYLTIRDYLRVLRSHRLLILAVAALFAGAAYGVSKMEDPSYSAEASLSFRQGLADFDLLGGRGTEETQDPTSQPLVNAQLVEQRRTLDRVKRELGTRRSVGSLQGSLDARVEERTALLVVEARSGDRVFAARLANATARAVALRVTREARRRFRRAARSLRRQLQRLRGADRLALGVTQERLARIETLADFARPAELVDRAQVPSAPVSPRPIRNTLLGLLVGLTLGIVAAFLREALDRRLRGSAQIQQQLALPVLGHVDQAAIGSLIASSNGRRALSSEDLEAFRILRSNLELLRFENPPRIIAVTSGLPEEGKSTVAAALAVVYAATGKRTVLVECDLRRPSLAGRLGVPSGPGLGDVLTGANSLREVTQEVAIPLTGASGADGSANVQCITAGSPVPNPSELLASQQFRSTLGLLVAAHDIVILDTAPLLSVADTRGLLPFVEAALLCVRASKSTQEEAHAAKETLERVYSGQSAIVVTGVRRGEEASYGYYSYAHTYGARD